MDIEDLTKEAWFSDTLGDLFGAKRKRKTIDEILDECPKTWGIAEGTNDPPGTQSHIEKQAPNSKGNHG